ncbi:MAG: hypothetical protein RLY23_1631 [Actinomycetota bacterium]
MQWHLHQDLVIALRLKREGDTWLAMDEGYIDAARLRRRQDGRPESLEIRSAFLKDYLAARTMGLYINSYCSRVEVFETAEQIAWLGELVRHVEGLMLWEGRTMPIHEGGSQYGSETAMFHMSRTDVDSSEDVPVMSEPTDSNVASRSWVRRDTRRKVFRVCGELWRSDWVDPGETSVRVRKDEEQSKIAFIIDAEGKTELAGQLHDSGRWLWFKPEVIPGLAHRRGGQLSWYTRDTGSVSCSPGSAIHFGVNEPGLVNVYAEDLAALPEWQQRIWAGHNVLPEGGVSSELLAAQVDAEPAETLAPEAFLEQALELLSDVGREKLGIEILREHALTHELLKRSHRFRAVDQMGMYALAKDIARLTADNVDGAALQTIVPPPKGERWRSLKSLEKVVARAIGDESARQGLGALVAVYQIRHADSHLPPSDLNEAFALLKVDQSAPLIHQATQMLVAVVASIGTIVDALKQPTT